MIIPLIRFILLLILFSLYTFCPELFFQKYNKSIIKYIISLFGFECKVIDQNNFESYSNKNIVYMHHTYIDNYFLMYAFGPGSAIIDTKFKNLPFARNYINNYDCIVVDKTKKNQSTLVADKMNSEYKYPIFIAPEGSKYCKSGESQPLGEFYSGSFIALKPVVPVVFKHYDYVTDPTWEDKDSLITWWFRHLSNINRKTIKTHMHIMKEMAPLQDETPKDFSLRVRQAMIDELKEKPKPKSE